MVEDYFPILLGPGNFSGAMLNFREVSKHISPIWMIWIIFGRTPKTTKPPLRSDRKSYARSESARGTKNTTYEIFQAVTLQKHIVVL